ncbi:MAG TPA: VWA domain-containing protein [Rhodanobacteraceae bacterium]|jgi:Ca-activated chloride channel family protein|nr:VWA domain-containing protein [Rhodanobacteraceae bacterium]
MSLAEFPLHFLRPWWWLALAPLPLVLWALARASGGRAALSRIADAALLPYLVRDTGTRRRFALGLAACAWLLATAAMSGPAWQKTAAPLYVNGAARVVALSLSNDMLVQDVKPNRMTRARFAVRDLLEGAGDARTALVAYAGDAFTVAPLTDDKHTVFNLLRVLEPNVMPVAGNDAAAGIRQGVALLQQAHVKGGEIVLVTDTADDAAVDAARTARAGGIRVDVLGVGTTEGAPVPRAEGGFANGPGGLLMARRDDAALAAVAAAGGGRYAVLQPDGGGADAFGAPLAESGHASQGERAQIWRDGGVWLLPILLVLAALAFRRGWLLVLAVLAMPVAIPTARASTWESLWANRDQRALQALQHGDVPRARQLAVTPGVRGAADYRAGDFAEAAEAFSQHHDARSRYNLGNALAEQGEYHKAIAAYRQALYQDPKLADARANLDAVQAWLKKHPPPSSPEGQGKPGDRTDKSGGAGSVPPAQQPGQRKTSPNGTPQAAPSSPGGHQQGQQGAAQPNPSTGQGKPGQGRAGQDRQGASAAQAAQQDRQADEARRGLEHALQGAKPGNPGPGSQAFALGRAEPQGDEKFDAAQRAMLHSVPDDPGALLRRKFHLEWEQRNGRQPEEQP